MAQRKRPKSAPDEQAVRREVVARLESDGVVKLTAVKPVALRPVLARELQIAARERLARLRVLGLLDELDARHGKPSAAVRRAVAADAQRLFKRRP